MTESSRPKVVAFVPAKAQSERIANKNVAVLDGELLFRRKLLQLLDCTELTQVCLDTESDEIAALADDLPVRRLSRPATLASNATDGHEMFAWECAQVPDADIYVQCLCTAPFVTAATVDRAVRMLIDRPDADSLVAVYNTRQYRWEDGEPAYGRGRIPNSVDLPPSLVEAMSLYVVRREPGASPPTRRFGDRPILMTLDGTEQVDINLAEDFTLAETICAGQRAKENLRLHAMRNHLSSPVLADITKDRGLRAVLPSALRPNSPGRILGRAKTLSLVALDAAQRATDAWRGIYDALDSYRFVRPGDVLMVANTAPQFAYFGDLNANLAVRAGAVGAVVDGMTRDTADVRALGLPVYARGAYCDDIKFEGTMAAMNRPITIGDIPVRNDDIVFADNDGVVVIPRADWPAIEAEAWRVLENESRIRIRAARGDDVRTILADHGAF